MADPKDNKGLDSLEREYASELERILGWSHAKTAAASGTPEEGITPLVKKAAAGITKIAGMSIEDIMRHPAFLSGVQSEIDSYRHVWEPIVEGFVRENLGR